MWNAINVQHCTLNTFCGNPTKEEILKPQKSSPRTRKFLKHNGSETSTNYTHRLLHTKILSFKYNFIYLLYINELS